MNDALMHSPSQESVERANQKFRGYFSSRFLTNEDNDYKDGLTLAYMFAKYNFNTSAQLDLKNTTYDLAI